MFTSSLPSRAASPIGKHFCCPGHPVQLKMQGSAWHPGTAPHDTVEREQRPFRGVSEQLDLLCQVITHR